MNELRVAIDVGQPVREKPGPGSRRSSFWPQIFDHCPASPVFAHPPPARPRVHMYLFSEFRAGHF